MKELVDAIKDWPVIVQGILGSAIFAILTQAGKKLFQWLSKHYNNRTKNLKLKALKTKLFRLRASDSTDKETQTLYLAGLWFRASREVILGLIWITFGHCFDSFIGVFGIVGYLGAIFYFFSAFEIVRPIEYDGDVKKLILETENEMTQLEKNT